MGLERMASSLPGYEKYGLFTTVEEVINHAEKTIPPDKIPGAKSGRRRDFRRRIS